MILYPAIDLMDGRCVRLRKGDFAQATIYGDDPLAMARTFAGQGAQWLHLVDLDGAKNPVRRQTQMIQQIARETELSVQTGGGIRSLEDAGQLLDSGVARVVVGSLAVRKPGMVRAMLRQFGPERICLAVDVNQGADGAFRVAVSGWQEETGVDLDTLVRDFTDAGLAYALCTDIARDGMMSGTNLDLYRHLRAQFANLNILASGGVRALDDLAALKALSVHGVIMGRALYEGAFSFEQAREVAASC